MTYDVEMSPEWRASAVSQTNVISAGFKALRNHLPLGTA